MGVFDIIAICVISVAFVGVVGTLIYKKIKGKSSGCDCGCSGCSHCSACHPQEKKDDKTD